MPPGLAHDFENLSEPLSATCSLDAAVARSPWDAIVVGAGIAGCGIARLLARRGHSVLLVEKQHLPRYKVCGCCLNLRSLRHLESWGIAKRLSHFDAPKLHSLTLYAGERKATLSLPGGMAVSRNILDRVLAESAIDAGAAFLPGARAHIEASTQGTPLDLTLSTAETSVSATGRLIIAADGLGGALMKTASAQAPEVATTSYIGLGAQSFTAGNAFNRGIIHMHCGRAGYVGAVGIEDSGIALAAAIHPSALKAAGSPSEAIATIYHETNQEPPLPLEDLKWQGTPTLTRRTPCIAVEGLIALGDATGYVEPFTGEGMAWAMEGTAVLDAYLASYSPEHWAQAARGWEQTYRRHMGRQRLLCRGITTALRYPRLSVAAVRCLSKAPFLSRSIVARINNVRWSSR